MKKILILCVVTLLLTGCNNNENKPIENNNEKKENQAIILENQIVNDLTIEDFNISTDDNNITYIYFDIVNNTENNINISKITYTLYEDEIEVFSSTSLVQGPIQPGDLKTITKLSDIDLSNVDSVKYVVE